MEIIGFYIFIVVGFVHRLKQIIQQMAERNHGAAGIHQKKQFHRIFPGLLHDDLQTAAIVAGLVHRAVDIQLRLRNVQPAGKLPQLPKCHLELSVVQHSVVPEIPVLSGAHYRKGRLVAGFAAHTHTAHISSCISEGSFPHGADPETSAIVLAVLVFQALPELFFHIFLIDLKILHLVHMISGLLVGQLHHIGLVQPAQHLLSHFRIPLCRPETLVKSHVIFIEIRLTLHQNHPGRMVKPGQ